MKKTICLVSVVIFLVGCASSPEIKVPVDDSIVKLHKAKEIQCRFTKGVEIDFSDLEVDKRESDEGDWDDMRLLFKIDPKSNNATIYYFEDEDEDEDEDVEDPYIFTSKVQRWEEGISFFIVYEERWAIATINVFNTEDILSDYGATYSISKMESDPAVIIGWGSCKVIE